MTRRKKSKTSSFQEVVVTKNRNRLDYEGRLRKKENKKKGLRPGNRNSQENISNSDFRLKKDPRLGSKKPVLLNLKESKNDILDYDKVENELKQIENDNKLHILLDRIDNGEKLGEGLTDYVNEKLNRADELFKILEENK